MRRESRPAANRAATSSTAIKDESTVPEVEPIEVKERRVRRSEAGVDVDLWLRWVKVVCPYCGRLATHGWPYEYDGPPGYRTSHCLGHQPGAYWIANPR